MALVAQANAVTSQYFDKVLTQTAYDNDVFFYKLKTNNKIIHRGGNQIQFPMRYAKYGLANAADFNAQLIYETKDTRGGCTLDWKTYNVKGLMTFKEQVVNKGESEIVSLIKDKLVEMKEDMEDRFATDIYTANPNGLGIESLATIVDSGSSYAGIATSSASTWAAQEDASTTALTLHGPGSLSYYFNLCQQGKHGPSLIVTTRDLLSKYESMFENQVEYDKKLVDAGFNNALYKGAPVVGDAYCPSGYLYGLDMDQFELVVDPDYNWKTTEWFELPQVGHPNVLAKVITWVGNLVCRNRRTNFKMTALNYAL